MDTSQTLDRSSTWLALFASAGTLVCCALPILLVSVGLGAVVASTTLKFPILVALSEHSMLMFGGTAVLLAIAGWVVYLRPYQCPVDPKLAMRCQKARKWNHRVWWMSVGVWITGASARFILPYWNQLLT